jgi:hypothetical protein
MDLLLLLKEITPVYSDNNMNLINTTELVTDKGHGPCALNGYC